MKKETDKQKNTYDCRTCFYKTKIADFCGFCLKKCEDEAREKRKMSKGEKSNGASNINA